MNIENYAAAVNSTAKNLFYSYIPLGSDYVIFNSGSSDYGSYSYTMYLRRVGSDTYDIYEITRSSNYSTYEISVSSGGDYPEDGFSVDLPYYCYSNIEGCGVRESLPVFEETAAVTNLVLCCLAILCVVFGGISLCRRRRSYP